MSDTIIVFLCTAGGNLAAFIGSAGVMFRMISARLTKLEDKVGNGITSRLNVHDTKLKVLETKLELHTSN